MGSSYRFLGYIYIIDVDQNPPSNVGMICNYENMTVSPGTQIQFGFWGENMSSFDIVIQKNGTEYKRFTNVSSPFYFTPTEGGDYMAYGIAKNSVGSTEANHRKFYVSGNPPTTVGMICNWENMYMNKGTEVEFGFWGENMTSFDIVIERNGIEYKRYNNVSSPFHFTPTESGDYMAYGIAKNSYGATEANHRKFYVNAQPPYEVGMICNWENMHMPQGTEVQFNFWGYYMTTFDIVIKRNGELYKTYNNVQSPFYYTATEEGNYEAYGIASNEDGSTEANHRKFYVDMIVPTTDTTAKRTNNEIDVQTTISNLSQTASCVVAVYDSSGNLIGQTANDVNSNTNSVTAYFPNYSNASYVKVFLWNSLEGMKPLTNGEKVNI